MNFSTDESGRPLVPPGWLVNNQAPRPNPPRRGTSALPSPGLWERFDRFIIGIGNGLARSFDPLARWAARLSLIVLLVCAILFIGHNFINYGLGSAVISVFVALIAAGFAVMVLHVIGCVFVFIFAPIRLLFWRGSTFLLTLCVIAAISLLIANQS